jgi:hypothetical protein
MITLKTPFEEYDQDAEVAARKRDLRKGKNAGEYARMVMAKRKPKRYNVFCWFKHRWEHIMFVKLEPWYLSGWHKERWMDHTFLSEPPR